MTASRTYGAIKLLDVQHAQALAKEIFDEDCYNFAKIPTGAIVLDVGACYGEFAIRCAVEKHCRVIAFEPCAENRHVLEANSRLNNLAGPQFIVSPLALGTPGRRTFMYRSEHPAGSMFDAEAKKHGCSGSSYEVDCVDIKDQLSAARERWGTAPIVLKMDCEGAEHEIFTNYESWIDYVTVIALEWHYYDGDHFRKLITPKGFSVHVEGGGPKPRPAWDPTIGAGLLFAVRNQ